MRKSLRKKILMKYYGGNVIKWKEQREKSIYSLLPLVSERRKNNEHSIWLYILSLGQFIFICVLELQTNLKLFSRFVSYNSMVKQFWNCFGCIIGLSKWVHVSMLLGARVLTVEEKSYKYGMGQSREESQENEQELEVLVWT